MGGRRTLSCSHRHSGVVGELVDPGDRRIARDESHDIARSRAWRSADVSGRARAVRSVSVGSTDSVAVVARRMPNAAVTDLGPTTSDNGREVSKRRPECRAQLHRCPEPAGRPQRARRRGERD